MPVAWCPNGQELLCGSTQHGEGLFLLPMDHAGSPHEIFTSDTMLNDAALSPSGRRVAYVEMNPDLAEGELFVRDLGQDGTAGNPVQISSDGAIEAKWNRDGSQVYYLNAAGSVKAATLAPGSPPRVVKTEEVWGASLDIAHMGAVLDDGSLIAVQRGEGEGETTELQVTLNILDELPLKQRQTKR